MKDKKKMSLKRRGPMGGGPGGAAISGEKAKDFFVRYLSAQANDGYHNPNTGLRTYFLTFGDGTRLEIMNRPSLEEQNPAPLRTGYIHLAFSLGSREAVDNLTRTLQADGFPVVSGPRTTGDGYYESCIAGPEGNLIELIA